MYAYCNIQAPSRKRCYHEKAINKTYSECVPVALAIQHAKPMSLITLSCVGCQVIPYLSTLSHKRDDFREIVMGTQNVCFDFL
jgi:hypothetical protein